MSYDNTNSGALFKNDRRTNDRQPNLRGTVNVEGVEYWVSAWTREVKSGPKAGEKMVSMALQPKEEQTGGGSSSGQGQSTEDQDFDDELPF